MLKEREEGDRSVEIELGCTIELDEPFLWFNRWLNSLTASKRVRSITRFTSESKPIKARSLPRESSGDGLKKHIMTSVKTTL